MLRLGRRLRTWPCVTPSLAVSEWLHSIVPPRRQYGCAGRLRKRFKVVYAIVATLAVYQLCISGASAADGRSAAQRHAFLAGALALLLPLVFLPWGAKEGFWVRRARHPHLRVGPLRTYRASLDASMVLPGSAVACGPTSRVVLCLQSACAGAGAPSKKLRWNTQVLRSEHCVPEP